MRYNIVINPGEPDCNPMMVGVNPDGEVPPMTPPQSDIETPNTLQTHRLEEPDLPDTKITILSIFPVVDSVFFIYIFYNTRDTTWVVMTLFCLMSIRIIELHIMVNIMMITQLLMLDMFNAILILRLFALSLLVIHTYYKFKHYNAARLIT